MRENILSSPLEVNVPGFGVTPSSGHLTSSFIALRSLKLIATESYLLIGLALVLIVIGHHFKRPLYLIVSGIVNIIIGFNASINDFTFKIGEYIVENSSTINLTLTNNTYIFQNTTVVTQWVWGILFWVFGLYLIIEGSLEQRKARKGK